MPRTIDRRTALRGLGTAIALPWMEAMAPSLRAQCQAEGLDFAKAFPPPPQRP